MVTLLTIQVLSILATALTNLLGILAFATDHWSIVTYDVDKLRAHTSWIVVENVSTGAVHTINVTGEHNHTHALPFTEQQLASVVFGTRNETTLYKNHKGIFRQCNYLSATVRERLKLSQCRVLKVANNQYDDVIHGMNNPGRELIRKATPPSPRSQSTYN